MIKENKNICSCIKYRFDTSNSEFRVVIYYCMLSPYNLISTISNSVVGFTSHLAPASFKIFYFFFFWIPLSVPAIFVLILWHSRLSKTDRSKVMEEKEATDEYVVTVEEKVSSFLPHFIQKSMCKILYNLLLQWYLLKLNRLQHKSLSLWIVPWEIIFLTTAVAILKKCFHRVRANSKTVTHLNVGSVYLQVCFSLVFCF